MKRRIQTTNVTTGIVVSPDKKAAMAAAAAAAENVLENDAKAKQQQQQEKDQVQQEQQQQQQQQVPVVTPATVVANVVANNSTARQSPLRVSSTASPRDDARKRTATPTNTPKKRTARTLTPQRAASSPVPSGATAAVPAIDPDSMAADLAKTCHDAEIELAVSKRVAAKDADIDRLERELFHALFLAIKLSLTEQGAKFNCKHDATDLLSSARRQNVAFNSSALTGWIDRQLRVAKK